MAERNYAPPTFRVQDQRSVNAPRIEDSAKARAAPDIVVGDSSWRDRLFEDLGGRAAQFLNKAADLAYSNLYLEGQAKAGLIESEAEIEGNPLTRDWEVAGYRDTMGKLALADNEAQFAVDLSALREQGPEKFNEYLAGRRDKIMPGLAGMSREARASAMGQLLLQDRAATKSWKTEHQKFIIDTKSQAVHAQVNTAMRTLGRSQLMTATGDMSQDDFKEQLRSTAGMVVGSVWMDNSLPPDVKQNLTFEVMQNTLASDQTAMYEFFQNNAIPDGQGGESTLISRLGGPEQVKLANQYREAMARTSDARSMFRMEQIANVEAQIDGGTYKGSYDDITGLLRPMVLNKTISGERYGALVNKYLDTSYKLENNSILAQALQAGDLNSILSSGKSVSDGVSALEATMAQRKVAPEQRLRTWLQVGNNGIEEGYKKAGEFLGVSVRQMVSSTDGKVLPQHANVFRSINQALREAEAKGNANTRVQLLSGMSEDDRMFTEQVLRRTDGGASLDESVQAAKDVQAKDSALTPSIRAARAATNSAEISKAIDEIEPMGLLGTFGTWAKSFVSADAAADLKLRPEDSLFRSPGNKLFGSNPTATFYAEKTREELRAEAGNVLLLRPSASADEVMSVAKANVAARTISTEQGPLILPRNVNLQSTFGIGAGNQAVIGKAIDGILKEHVPDSRWQLSFAQGRLFAQEFDKDGTRVGTGVFLQADQIKARILGDKQQEVKKADEVYGAGKTVSEDGVFLKYSGVNSAGVPYGWMSEFRDNLVAHEGVKATPYTDLSGNKDKAGNLIQTVGVGVSSHNPHYPKVGIDGRVSGKAINESFLGASNDAAQAGVNVARALGKGDNAAAFQLFAELAYQSGTAFMDQKNKTGDRYRAFGTALQNGEVAQAQDVFKTTAAWYYSRDPKNPEKETRRQKAYLRLIEKSLQ